MATEPHLGVYRHYKGSYYEVLAVATHSEDLEKLVIYRSLGEEEPKTWARPLSLFTAAVEVEGEAVPRFSPWAPA